MTALSTSEVLNKAADLIEERGWTTGSIGWMTSGDSALCLEGGILAAMESHIPLIAQGDGAPLAEPEFRSCPAYRAVHEYLTSDGSLDPGDELWEFNDKAVEERVIGVLRATALIEAARERESVEV